MNAILDRENCTFIRENYNSGFLRGHKTYKCSDSCNITRVKNKICVSLILYLKNTPTKPII